MVLYRVFGISGVTATTTKLVSNHGNDATLQWFSFSVWCISVRFTVPLMTTFALHLHKVGLDISRCTDWSRMSATRAGWFCYFIFQDTNMHQRPHIMQNPPYLCFLTIILFGLSTKSPKMRKVHPFFRKCLPKHSVLETSPLWCDYTTLTDWFQWIFVWQPKDWVSHT